MKVSSEMPELAGFYSAGFLISMVFGVWFGIKQRGRYYSKSYLLLQKNLQRINLRWNDLNLSVEALKREEAPNGGQLAEEYHQAKISMILFIMTTTILSWLGLIFLTVVWISLWLFAKPRIETELFASPLATQELADEDIKIYYSSLRQINT